MSSCEFVILGLIPGCEPAIDILPKIHWTCHLDFDCNLMIVANVFI